MNKMIERVMDAIAEADGLGEYATARAAIQAMREPTDAMINGHLHDDYDPRHVWQMMIDEVLRDAQ